MGETIVIPPEKLASHTLGWWQRNLPDTDPTECEPLWKVALAHELLLEAQRRIIIERLDSVMEFLAVGATPAQAMDRVHKLVLEYYGRPAATMKAAA